MAGRVKTSRLVVTAPLCVVKHADGASSYLSRGDVLPESVTVESVDLLVELGFVSHTK